MSSGDSTNGPVLFTPFRLREIELLNRIVVSPMAQYSAKEGCATEWHYVHLGSMAVSGAGLVIAEFAAVQPEGRISPSDLGIWSERTAQSLSPIVRFFREYSEAKFGIQLAHSGRKGSTNTFWEGHLPLAPEQGGWALAAPSALAYPGRPVPGALDDGAMEALLEDYASATRRSHEIGVDLIEIHAAHGYLLHSFLSPLSNQRQDRYGGSLENRIRYPLAIFDRVRAVWPQEKPLGVRISACDWIDGGWTVEDSIILASELRKRGCDYVTASSGGLLPEQKITTGPGYQIPLARRIRREAELTTMAVGLITEPEQAEKVLADESADLVALGRGMLADPRWPWNAADELGGACWCPPQYERARRRSRHLNFLDNPHS